MEEDHHMIPVKDRFLFGRTFIETYVLNLLDLERRVQTLEVKKQVAKALDDLVCTLGVAEPSIPVWYHRSITRIIQAVYKDIPKPELDPCNEYEQLKKHVFEFRRKADQRVRLGQIPRPLFEEEVESFVADVIKRSALLTLLLHNYLSSGKMSMPWS